VLAVDGGPPPLRLSSVTLARHFQWFAFDERQLVRVLCLVLASRIDNAVVCDAQLADCFWCRRTTKKTVSDVLELHDMTHSFN